MPAHRKTTLKVAIDGMCLTKKVSGIGNYVANILRSLREEKSNLEYHILCPAPLGKDYEDLASWTTISSSSGLKWYFSTLGNIVKKGQFDCLWAPSHKLPFFTDENTPTILTIHDLVWQKFPKTMSIRTRFSERLFFNRSVMNATTISCVSHSTKNDMALYAPQIAKKLTVLYPAISKINQIPKTKISEKQKKFALFIGTFEPRKNLPTIIDAYLRLPLIMRKNHHLKILGTAGWGQQTISTILQKYNDKVGIEVIENPEHDYLLRQLRDCHYLIQLSLYEGFGLPVAEAQAYGKPSLISDNSSLPEVAGKAGIAVNPLSPEEISQQMKALFCDEKLYRGLSWYCQSNVDRFHPQLAAASFEQTVYESYKNG